MSRSAVSCEHFASPAHFFVVSLPVKPSSRSLFDARINDNQRAYGGD